MEHVKSEPRKIPSESEKAQMEKAIEELERLEGLEKYSRYCGPRVVSLLLGITPMEAAIRLCEIEAPKGNWEQTSVFTIGKILGKTVESTARAPIYGAGKNGKLYHGFNDKFPTLAQWCEENKGRKAIVRADHHFSLVAFGIVIDKDENMRGRVTHAIFLD